VDYLQIQGCFFEANTTSKQTAIWLRYQSSGGASHRPWTPSVAAIWLDKKLKIALNFNDWPLLALGQALPLHETMTFTCILV